MYWACVERDQSIYQACDGCSTLYDRSELQQYNILREWGHLAEWIECKKGVFVFCNNCRDAMDAYRESTREHAAGTEPSRLYLPGTRARNFDNAFPVGIHCIADQETLGLGCAQQRYGVNATEEILQGFIYHDDAGHQIRRLTMQDTDETIRCDKCWLELWMCNAREVSR